MSNKYRAHLVDELENELLDEILSLPEADLEKALAEVGLNGDEHIVETRELITHELLACRKQRLKDARDIIDNPSVNSVRQFTLKTVTEAHDYIVGLVSNPNIQSGGLTAAFREGQNIPDEDLVELANELLQLSENDEIEN
jgi:hypothetical protein